MIWGAETEFAKGESDKLPSSQCRDGNAAVEMDFLHSGWMALAKLKSLS